MSDDTNTLPSNAPDQVFADATQLMGASKEVMIDVAGVDKFFGEFQALKNINMRVGQQEVVVVIGPSGSGKSTLIRCINRLEKHDRGQILVGGVELSEDIRNIQEIRRETGMVFQSFNLFPHLTVLENITLAPRQVRKTSKRDADAIGMDLLERVKIPDQAHKFPGQLSGGQQQRVAIARALLSNPDLLLLDEPLEAIDRARKLEILSYLERLRDELRLPMLYVSHSVPELARLATDIVIMDADKLVACGPASDLLSDPSLVPQLGLAVAGASVLARLTAQSEDGLSTLNTSAGQLFLPRIEAPLGTRVRVRILAQDVMISVQKPEQISALNILHCHIISLRPGDGPGMIVELNSGNDRLLARITARSAKRLRLQPGLACYAIVKTLSIRPAELAI